jgi:non-ribosomal peptide synthetase component F
MSNVSRAPKNMALIDSTGLALTYEELDLYSDKLATHIYQLGLPDNRRIGICIARSCDTIAAMLAVLKLGCTYIPLATDFPENRRLGKSYRCFEHTEYVWGH